MTDQHDLVKRLRAMAHAVTSTVLAEMAKAMSEAADVIEQQHWPEHVKSDKHIESAWKAIERGWDIEPREYFEREAVKMGFSSPLEMAIHHMWKREPKPKFTPPAQGTPGTPQDQADDDTDVYMLADQLVGDISTLANHGCDEAAKRLLLPWLRSSPKGSHDGNLPDPPPPSDDFGTAVRSGGGKTDTR